MTTIGDLTLNDIGKTRIRTRYENATIEGLITSLSLDISVDIGRQWNGTERRREYSVLADLRLGKIELLQLKRAHPCEVIA